MTASQTPQARNDIYGMMLPRKAPVAIPAWLDFDTDLVNELDLTFAVDMGYVDFISGVFINNTSNEILEIKVMGGTNQVVPFPANTAGYVPLLFSNPPKVVISSPANFATKVQALFYNVPMLPYLYPNNTPAGETVDIVSIGGTPLTGDFLPVAPTAPTFTDYTLDLAGGDEVAVAAGDAARYLQIQNPVGNSDVTVNLAGGDATVSGIVLTAGGSLTLENGLSNAVNVAGSAAETLIIFGAV